MQSGWYAPFQQGLLPPSSGIELRLEHKGMQHVTQKRNYQAVKLLDVTFSVNGSHNNNFKKNKIQLDGPPVNKIVINFE